MDTESAELRKFRKELNAGAVSLVLLALLERAAAPMYGYQIGRSLEEGASAAPGAPSSTSETAPAFSSFRNFRSSALSVSMVAPLPLRECRSPSTGDPQPQVPARALPSLETGSYYSLH